jgi:hypothetical protein
MSFDGMRSTSDQVIECRDCRNEFVLTEGERQFYEAKGLYQPVRCKPCRDFKRQARGEGRW